MLCICIKERLVIDVKLQVKYKKPGMADCEIVIRAKGFLMAMLYWSVENTPLSGWSSMAALPLDASGKGYFRFEGNRGIPPEATHLYARCITPDYSRIEDVAEKIPDAFRTPQKNTPAMFTASVMSDLHLSGKSGKIARAIQGVQCDTVLLVGDLVNDGYPEQFALLKKCIEERIPYKILLSVTGNHDQLFSSASEAAERENSYELFQEYLLCRARKQGIRIENGPCGAYMAYVGNVGIIGLQCVDGNRNFVFSKGGQLEWLRERLAHGTGWHIILCHAPLLKHNPQRNDGKPYLDKNRELQEIIDSNEKIIFISGHTHASPNRLKSSVECTFDNRVVYMNDGSVTPTDLAGEILTPAEWKDGVRMELSLWEDQLEIRTKSVHTGICYPRGYYRFCL